MRNVTPLYAAFPWTGAPDTAYLTTAIQGTTFLDAHLQGVRNIILIGHGLDESVELPMFEAVFNRVNVYRNPLLDPRVTERVDPTYHTRYVDRMDRLPRSPNAAPLKLPTTLAEDPHLHYVPIGNIPGVSLHAAERELRRDQQFRARRPAGPARHRARHASRVTAWAISPTSRRTTHNSGWC
jgi:hypothetical protein